MRKKKLFLLVVLVISLLVVGCGPSDVESDEPGPVEGEDVADKEMVVGIPKLTDSFDIYNTTNGFESVCMAQVYDTLVIKDDDGKTIPSLAKDWEITDGGKTITFYLREDVKFTNGKKFTSADAKYSIDEGKASAYTGWVYDSLDSCKIVDEYTIKLNMKAPNVSFLEYLSSELYSAMLSEETVKEIGDKYGTSVETTVGTGPYILKEWKAGDYFVYEANPEYFRGEPEIKNVKLKSLTDTNAAIIGLQTGEVQAYFNDLPGISYDAVEKDERVNVVSYPSTILFEGIMNTENGPFSDIRMRKALAYAVDREKMLIVGTEGFGAITDYPGDRQGYTAGDPKIDVWYDLDLDKAKDLVKEAGMEGEKVVIKTYATDPYPKLATVLQDTMTNIGLNAEVLQMERGAFIDEVLAKGDFDVGICRWAAATKDMHEVMYGIYHTESIGSPGNWSLYSNPEVDDLLFRASGEIDEAAREQLYADAIEIVTEDVGILPLYYPNGSRAYSIDVVIEEGLVEYDRFFNYSWKK